jgi:hypothetical protein
MTGASSLAFPASRKLAGWWRQLAAFHPRTLWVGHLFMHRVEALVRLTQPRALDSLALFVLRALTLQERAQTAAGAGEATLHWLEARLQLGAPVLRAALRELEAEGLVGRTSDGGWPLTSQGRRALEQRSYTRITHERRTFHFRDGPGDGAAPHHFLDLHNGTGIPWPLAAGRSFDARALHACIGRSVEWKRSYGFPQDVQEIVELDDAHAPPAANPAPPQPELWRRVIVDRAERMLVLLCLAGSSDAGEQLLGLAIREDGWVLLTASPLFTLGAGWRDVFPELSTAASPSSWRDAWDGWCAQRGLPEDEVAACLLDLHGVRLRAVAPAALIQRLRATRSDALRGEAWLLGGSAPIRAAAQVELVAAD